MMGPVQPLHCAQCGEPLAAGYQVNCPRCGLPVSASLAQAQGHPGAGGPAGVGPQPPLTGAPVPTQTGAPHAPQPPVGFDQPTSSYPPPATGYGQASYPSVPMTGQPPYPGTVYPAGPASGVPYAGAPGYGSPYPGSPAYGQPGYPSAPLYGQYAPPSVPAYPQAPGYPSYGPPSYGPPSYGTPPYGAPGGPSATLPGYGPSQNPGAPVFGEPYAPMPPDNKREGGRAGLIAGLILAVLLVFGASAYALVALAGKGATTLASVPRASGTATVAATSTVAATATPSPAATPSGTIYASALKGSVFGWPDRSGCAPSPDGYHVQADVSCFAPTGDLGDFDLRVTAQQISGDPANPYGVTFRGDVTSTSTGINNIYAFFIASNGRWYFFKFQGGQPTLIQQGSSQAINGSGANVIGVRAQGSHFSLTVNGTTLADTYDGSIAKGKCGLQGYAGSDIRFTDLSIRGV